MSSSRKDLKRPPKWAERLLTWSCPKDSLEEVQGDLLELYNYWVETVGEKKARRRYILNAIRLQKPLLKLLTIKRPDYRYLKNNLSMLMNYIVVASRSLLKNKVYVTINTFGVGIAMACCLAAYLIVAYDLEFDNFHSDEKVERVFKIHTHLRERDGTITQHNSVPMPLATTAVSEITGIERYTRYLHDGAYMRCGNKGFSERISFADSTFFDMFDFPLADGNRSAFRNKYSIFLTTQLAEKYFGNDDAVGKMLTLNFSNGVEIQVIIGGVLRKVPINNTFVFDAMMRIENFQDVYKPAINDWSDERAPSTFIELATPENAETISNQLDKYISIRNIDRRDAIVVKHKLEHFKARLTQDDMNGGNTNLRMRRALLVMFSSMAAMILLVACFNLTNTTMAMTARRLKEIGIRKTIGAFRKQIIFQFLIETIITVSLSLGVGLLLAQWIVPAFTALWNLPFSLGDLDGFNLFVTLIGLGFFASLLAGIYPALFNSKFKPIMLLKGAVKIKGTSTLTRTLVTLQFALSVIALIGGVIFTQNAEFQQTFKFGYDKEMILTVDIQGEKELEAMENAIRSNPKILSLSASEHNVGQSQMSNHHPVLVGSSEYPAQIAGVGKNYFQTMGLKLIEGRFLNDDNTSDRQEGVIVNRAFVDKAGMKDPIDKIITVDQQKRHIVGVIENHVEDVFIAETPESFVFYLAEPGNHRMMQVKADAKDLAGVREYLEDAWKKMFPSKPFESQYQQDIVLADAHMVTGSFKSIFLFLTVLGAVLSVSGIFSLASLNVARRTKEIGIRKALGASVTNVMAMLNKEFAIILLLAAIAGSVGGFFVTGAVLGAFNMIHVPVGIITLASCGLVVFSVGIITTTFTVLKAASTNPVDTLRSE